MRDRAAAWLASSASVLAFVFSAFALLLVELNGGEIGTADTTGAAILAISFSTVGAVIVARRPGNWIGWVLLVGGFFNSLNALSLEYSTYALLTNPDGQAGGPFFAWLFNWAFAFGLSAFPLTLLLFPTGRLLSPRWSPVLWLVVVAVALMVVPVAVAAWPLRGPDLVSPDLWSSRLVGLPVVRLQQTGVTLAVLSMLASVVSLALRFRRAVGEERQQIKWLVYAGAVTFVGIVTASPAAPFDLPEILEVVLSYLAWLVLPSIPVAVGIAILKHRLYDIDVVINRTLVYGLLTGALGLVYLGGVALLQELFRTLTGQGSTFAVVASTLAIAALFSPFRRRIQTFIDRRFYRKKYDAKETLEAFSAKLRDETDLDELNGDLVLVVKETMQPAHVSLWLREFDREARP